MLSGQHLLGIKDLNVEQIAHILETAVLFQEVSRRKIKKVPTLRGRTILNVFFEPSTRTRVSFELAAKRLSADALNITVASSSTVKGESLRDTLQTLDAMQADAIVIRHAASGAPHFLSQYLAARVINAGDGCHEHPTQALLDLLTIQQHFTQVVASGTANGVAAFSFAGLRVAIIGDINHSRVARSNLLALTKLGAEVRLAGPRTLVAPEWQEISGAVVCARVEEALAGADVVMALRLQKERMLAGLLPDLREYAEVYGISTKRLRLTAKHAILLHPGPVNRGVELADDLVDSERSVILTQVENGVAIRAAVLYLLLGGGEEN